MNVDVYPVGALADVRLAWRGARVIGLRTEHARQRRRILRMNLLRDWRRRSYWNGWLAEHEGCHHGAGRGLTQTAALRRAYRICTR